MSGKQKKRYKHCPNCGSDETHQRETFTPESGFVVQVKCSGCGYPRGLFS